MKKILIYCLVIFLSSCSISPRERKNINFINADVLETKILRSMMANTEKITVTMPHNFSVKDEIPEHLSNFFNVIEESGGEVNDVTIKTRSGLIVSAIVATLWARKNVERWMAFKEAHNYNVEIFQLQGRTQHSDRTIERIVFSKRMSK